MQHRDATRAPGFGRDIVQQFGVQGDGAGDGLREDEERGTQDRSRGGGGYRCGVQELAEPEELALLGCGVG